MKIAGSMSWSATQFSCDARAIELSSNELLQKVVEILRDRLSEPRQLDSRSVFPDHLVRNENDRRLDLPASCKVETVSVTVKGCGEDDVAVFRYVTTRNQRLVLLQHVLDGPEAKLLACAFSGLELAVEINNGRRQAK